MNPAASQRLVFVSYATPDREEADRIVARLEAAGITCWMAPRDIPLGANYGESIVDAIERAELLILLLSGAANLSPHVANEIERAVNYRKPIVPVRLADIEPSRSMELHVSTRQWVELWGTSDRRESGTDRLVSTLRETLHDKLGGEESPPDSALRVSNQVEPPQSRWTSSGDLSSQPIEDPVESDHTEVEIISHDGSLTLLCDPEVAYPTGFGPSKTKEGIAVRRGVEEATLHWSRLRMLRFRSRQETNESGTTVWRYTIEATLSSGRITEVELLDDWTMAFMGGGGTGLLWGQSDLGEVKIPFNRISVLRILKYARSGGRS